MPIATDEPQAIARDAEVAERLRALGIDWRTRKDQVIFELDEVRTKAGGAFSVYTPYRRAWLENLKAHHIAPYDIDAQGSRFAPATGGPMPTLADLGFERAEPT